MKSEKGAKAELYVRYPSWSVLVYNGATVFHFLLGGIGIAVGYGFWSWAGYTFGIAYLAFAFADMYVVMPMTVCPHCTYYRTKGSLCVSGLNVLSRSLAKEGNRKNFPKRAKGLFCPNNLYLASLIAPVAGMIPAMAINFSVVLLVVFLVVTALLLFRFLIIFPRMACLHCRAKYRCPQAEVMGLRSL